MTPIETAKTPRDAGSGARTFVQAVHGVRYQVRDVARSVAFYTTELGFTLEHQQLPAFASVSLGGVQLLLSGPQASRSSSRIRTGIPSSCSSSRADAPRTA